MSDVLYVCDLNRCSEKCSFPDCRYTTDVTHARNFSYDGVADAWYEDPTKDQFPICNELKSIGIDTEEKFKRALGIFKGLIGKKTDSQILIEMMKNGILPPLKEEEK